jgi:hypothetical protein
MNRHSRSRALPLALAAAALAAAVLTACSGQRLTDLLPLPATPTAVETPVLMCTPPACAPGEVYSCPGDCPGGCGTVCVAPTVTPVTGEIAPAPADWDSLEGWLAALWRGSAEPAAVRAALQASGWQRDFNDWLAADFDGDLRDEWAVILYDESLPGAPFGSPGNLWIVNGDGVVYRQYPIPSQDIYEFLAPTIVGVADMTGDRLPELVTDATVCGAHTCYGNYRIIGFAEGGYRNLVSREPVGEGDAGDTISLSYPEPRLEDYNQDGRAELLVHGGTIGSAGAGVVRPRTEIWAWDGAAVTLADTQLDPTEYRHHVLYEANDRMAAGDLDGALLLYEAAINDPALRNDAFFMPTPEETYAAISQFAAFRLILIDLLRGDAGRAESRLAWLAATYPGTAAADGAAALIGGWTGPEGQAALCESIEATLAARENPTGALADLGYGNPGLTAAEFCP